MVRKRKRCPLSLALIGLPSQSRMQNFLARGKPKGWGEDTTSSVESYDILCPRGDKGVVRGIANR